MPTIEKQIECQSCGGTGVYTGVGECKGAAVICHTPEHVRTLACPMMADQGACHKIEGFTDVCDKLNGSFLLGLLRRCNYQPNKKTAGLALRNKGKQKRRNKTQNPQPVHMAGDLWRMWRMKNAHEEVWMTNVTKTKRRCQ